MRSYRSDEGQHQSSSQGAGKPGARTLTQGLAQRPAAIDRGAGAARSVAASPAAATAIARKPIAGGDDPFGLHLAVTQPGDAVEVEAERAADAMVAGRPATVASSAAGVARVPFHSDDAWTPRPLPEVLELRSFDFVQNGAVAARPDGKGGVVCDAPSVEMTAEVGLTAEANDFAVPEIGRIEVGAIQNVISSERVGVYKKPDGTIAAEYHAASGTRNDAQWQDGATPTAPKVRDPPAPWIEHPQYIDPPEGLTATAHMFDRPGFGIPSTMSGGTLRETRGVERFVTSASAKRGDEVHHFASEAWQIPWAMTIDAAGNGSGQPGAAAPTATTPAALDGPLAINSPEWFRFPTVADAKEAPPDVLLESLAVSRTEDPDSYKNALAAIEELNWRFVVTVKCTNTYAWLGKDTVSLQIEGNLASQSPDDFELNSGESQETAFNFLSVFDPGRWQRGQVMTFTVTVDGHTFTSWLPAPFTQGSQFTAMPNSQGRYEIACRRV